MNNKFSVVIRNKDEAPALENVLSILREIYYSDINEIIVVDNNSSDNSEEIALRYNCKVVKIDNFSYGRAINFGMEVAISKHVLLLSAHAIPIGKDFFKNTFLAIKEQENVAGVRFINSFENYNRAIQNNFKVTQPLKFGLTAGCCIVNKDVWERFKFNEDLIAIEDKEWSERVMHKGFEILDLNETYFYFLKRDSKSLLNRFKIETIAEYQFSNNKFHSPLHSLASFFKKIILTNSLRYFKVLHNDFQMLKAKIEIHNKLKKDE